ncbi:hypothetical protein AX17_000430 [Amanita inopinata Kibby_2008]|nr:hypothetical protein AX17_000430 [Amanita inopinata Kibby_2008]
MLIIFLPGFARRYFILYSDGTLAYSFDLGKPIRDQLSLHRAAISTSLGRKDIHIDSNTATFHLKCLTTDDFQMWMAVLRRFIRSEYEARRSASVKHANSHNLMPVNKSLSVIEEMGLTISELEESISAIVQDYLPKKHHKKSERHKDHAKEVVLGLFRKASYQPSMEDPAGSPRFLESLAIDCLPPPIQHAVTALNTLKSQHTLLSKSWQQLIRIDSTHSTRGSVLPTTTEEEVLASPDLSSPATKHSNRGSFATTASDSLSEWYDAPDGPEEFIMDADEQELPVQGHIASVDSGSSVEHAEDSGADTDIEDDVGPEIVSDSKNVVRRTELPAKPGCDEGSLFAILKKNVGKDLSTIAFPVTFNEPLTLLQRVAEEVEYYDLLDKAVQSEDPVTRICYVAAFAVSGYAHTLHRSGRKGFNPMLGETFEDVRMKFIAEKVRHNPLEMAYHAEGQGWELTATSCGRTKFWGKSLEIIPLGMTHVRIGDNHYVWKKPSSFMRNLVVGTKYLEHCGQMTIEEASNQVHAVVDFKQNGYWGPSNVVSGMVYGADGQTVCHLEGKWDEQFSQTLDSSHFHVLWRVNPFPKNTSQYYGFTSFGMTLNEITNDLVGKLPPTDSRLRPDVRALEEGDLDRAEEGKQRIEELQRQRRRNGQDCKPRWFRQSGEEWIYAGGYWEARTRGWKTERTTQLW